jgi:nitrile hydratase accessory protein
MQTRFEHFAATSMLGCEDSPPRRNGALHFRQPWEERAFGLALALAKKGHYEWEAFRQALITSIAEWEAEHETHDPTWDYYQRWLIALERLAIASDVIDAATLERRTAAIVEELRTCQPQGERNTCRRALQAP